MIPKLRKTSDVYVAETRKLVDDFVAAYNKGDADEIASLFAEGAVFMPPGEPAICGRDAIHSRFQAFFDGISFTLELHAEDTDLVGDILFERGTYTAYSYLNQMARGGAGEYLLLFERDEDGSWKISSWGTAGAKEITPSTMDSKGKSGVRVPASGSPFEADSSHWHQKWTDTLMDHRGTISTEIREKLDSGH